MAMQEQLFKRASRLRNLPRERNQIVNETLEELTQKAQACTSAGYEVTGRRFLSLPETVAPN